MREIKLTQGYVALVDDQDYELVSQYKWHVTRATAENMYAAHTINTTIETGRYHQKTILMHRLIMDAKKGELVDHYDGNGLNNTRENLRKATPRQNMQNKRKINVSKTSKFKGVTKRWRMVKERLYGPYFDVRIAIEAGVKAVGSFRDELLAADAYNQAALEHFGLFARLNTFSYEETKILTEIKRRGASALQQVGQIT